MAPGFTSTFTQGFISVALGGSKTTRPRSVEHLSAIGIKPWMNVLVNPGQAGA